MKKKRTGKGAIIVLVALIVICLTCGTVGYLESKKTVDDNKPNTNKDYQVTYRYYVDGEEVEEMVKNETTDVDDPDFEGSVTKTPTYTFERYTCTNNVTGEFDEEKWEFNPDLTANTTCRLYFIKSLHKVTFKTSNGILPSQMPTEDLKVEINKEGKINILANEGYKFDKVECNNDVLAAYDENTKDLTVSNVKKDSLCTVSFKVRDYEAEVTATFGSVDEPKKKSTNYGGNLEFDVSPSENYKYYGVNCSNGQKASYNEARGTLTVSGLTNDTVCNVEFRPVKFNITLEVLNGTIIDGEKTQTVSEGKTVTFKIKANNGYVLSQSTPTCKNGTEIVQASGIVSIYNVTKDDTCKIVLKENATTTE